MDLDKLCYHCMTFSLDEKGMCISCHQQMPMRQKVEDALPIGTILRGRYLVGSVLGNGGFGLTYVVLDLSTRQRMAVKEYMPRAYAFRMAGTREMQTSTKLNYEANLKKFKMEAQTLNGLRTLENIVHITELFCENNTAYYVMEYLKGRDLLQLLCENGGKLSLARTMELIAPLFDTLRRIHAVKVIHRDISPDNIFICDDGNIKLIDFGAARAEMYAATISYNVCLKPGYAAVEQYTRGAQGPCTDIYGLACTIYRCITGLIPPEATSRKPNDGLEPPSKFAEITDREERALLKGMAFEAGERWQSATEFGAALQEAMNKGSVGGEENVKEVFFWRRVCAYWIDFAPFGMVANAIVWSTEGYSSISWINLCFWIVAVFACTLMESFGNKRSPGKQAMKLRISTKTHCELSWTKYLARNLIRVFFFPDSLLFLFSGGRVCLHDLILGTTVKKSTGVTVEKGEAPLQMKAIKGTYMGTSLPLTPKGIVLGRHPEQCNLVFPDGVRGVSGKHCAVYGNPSEQTADIVDLGSRFGTFVNEQTVRIQQGQRYKLRRGDTFRIGEEQFRIEG